MGTMEYLDPMREVPSSFSKDLALVNSDLYSAMTVWLRKHGKATRPKLTEEQKEQMLECFELMDQDGSGAIDADELGAAFKLLGIRMKKSEMEQLVNEVDHDGSGEVEYQEFLEIMTTTLQRLADEAEENNHNDGQVPFGLMATAYRRKRLMEGIINGDKEVQAQITEMTNKANAEAIQEQLRKSEAARQASRRPNLPSMSLHRPRPLPTDKVDKAMLASLPRDERRLVEGVARGTHMRMQRSVSRPRSTQMAMRSGDFQNTASHKLLLQMPEVILEAVSMRDVKEVRVAKPRLVKAISWVFDIRLNRSSIKLPSALSSRGVSLVCQIQPPTHRATAGTPAISPRTPLMASPRGGTGPETGYSYSHHGQGAQGAR